MAGIYPNTDIILCMGVPIDSSYEHTLYCTSKTQQYNAISAYAKYTLNAQSYQRTNRGWLRIAYEYTKVIDCNYMMYRNTSYTTSEGGTKWFYAFIKTVEYVNDHCCEIEFEIDVMQTWYFDYHLGWCYVEREHTLTDKFDENYQPEPIDNNVYVVQNKHEVYYKWNDGNDNLRIYIYYQPNMHVDPDNPTTMDIIDVDAIAYDTDGAIHGDVPVINISSNSLTGTTGLVDGMYVSYYNVPLPFTGGDTIHRFRTGQNITRVVNKILEIQGNIIGIAVAPVYDVADYTMHEDQYFNDGNGHNYLPKNKKMYHAPYKKITVASSDGKEKDYLWENFTTSPVQGVKDAVFGFSKGRMPTACAYVYPKSYQQRGIDNGVAFSGFPTYTWSEDSFLKWWEQNKLAMTLNLVSAGLNIATGAMNFKSLVTPEMVAPFDEISGAIGGMNYNQAKVGENAAKQLGVKGVTNLLGIAGAISQQANTPDSVNGAMNADTIIMAQDRLGFVIYEMCILPDVAESIDNFFTKYGYACNKLKVPNIESASASALRPHWNYIKTSVCEIDSPTLNSTDADKIASIFNNGITFWDSLSNVGNYGLSNLPRM